MKKLIAFLMILSITTASYATAPDRRISDSDGDVLKIGAGGGIFSSGASIVSGKNTLATAGTAQVLASDTSVHKVILRAGQGNQGPLYIGPSTVSSSSYQLMTGVVLAIDVDNLNDIYFDGTVAQDTIEYIGTVQ